MKEIVKNYYAIVFGITGGRTTAYRITIFILAVFCVLSLSGISLLLRDMLPVKQISIAFKFPYYIVTGIAMYILLYALYPASKIASKNQQKQTNYLLVLVTMLIAILLYGYSLFTSLA